MARRRVMRRLPIVIAVIAVVLTGTSCDNAASVVKTTQGDHVANPVGGTFSGTYALMAKPDFCGPSGNHPNEVMYVDGANVTVPGDEAGPFTGSATRQGTESKYHLVLLQPANDIMEDITVTVSGGGDNLVGTGQQYLEAGNNPPCSISFTGRRTSTSVPPTTATTVAPVPASSSTTSTTVAPVSGITLASLEAAVESGEGAGTIVTCGPAPTGLGMGAYVACGLFNPKVGGAVEILEITGTSASSFKVVAGPGSSVGCSQLNAGERAALNAAGTNCDPNG
jgi:hypothetical protein